MRKMLAIAMAAIMAFSCVTAGVCGSESSEAATDDCVVGDSWGFDREVTTDDIIELYNGLMKKIKPDFEGADKQNVVNSIKFFAKMDGKTIDRLDFDIEGGLAGIVTLAERDSSGTAARFDGGINAAVKFDMRMTDDSTGTVTELNGIKAAVTSVFSGYLFMTPANEMTGYSMSADASLGIIGGSNLDMTKDGIVHGDVRDVDSVVTVNVIGSGSYDTPVKFIPDGSKVWTHQGNLVQSRDTSVRVTDNLADPGDGKTTYFDKDRSNDPFDYCFHANPKGDGYRVHVTGSPLLTVLGSDDMTYHWSDSTFTHATALGDDVINDIHGTIREWGESMDMNDDAVRSTIEFYDGGRLIEDLTVHGEIGEIIDLPRYDEGAPDGQEFVGWIDGTGNFFGTGFDDTWTLTGSYSFEARYGTYTDEEPTEPYDGTLIWNTDTEKVKDTVFKNSVMKAGPVVVNVFDGEKVKYSWKFMEPDRIDDDTRYSPEITEKATPDKAYIDNIVSGRENLYLEFGSSGNVGTAYVSYDVSDRFPNGTVVCIYRDSGHGLEFVEDNIVYDGIIYIHPGHCSDFLLVAGMPGESAPEETDDEPDDTTFYAGLAILAAIVVILAVAVYIRHRRNGASAEEPAPEEIPVDTDDTGEGKD